jgi:alpha-L-rhamnosidase
MAIGDWKGAAWIGGQIGQYRKSFTVKGSVTRATAYVIGLGYYKLHLNGRQVSSHELGAFTTFDRRVLYDTLDVTEAVNAASAEKEQVLGLVLGNGWYNLGATDPFDGGHPINIGPPTLRVRLSLQYASDVEEEVPSPGRSRFLVAQEGADDNVVTDTSWLHTAGPVSSAHIYMGTIYNATRETPGWTSAGYKPSSSWSAAMVVPPPSDHVKLSSHAVMPQIRITQSYIPCEIWQSSPGVFVFDFCQNMAGFATLHVPEGAAMEPNARIEMVHAEAIRGPPENNSAIFNHFFRGKQTLGKSFEMNTYVTRGNGAAIDWSPSFTYAGFRYVQLTGHPGTPDRDTLTAHFIHTDNEDIGSVSFSDNLLNAVQHNTRASARSNFQHVPTVCASSRAICVLCGAPAAIIRSSHYACCLLACLQDCPQRERRGWLGDAQVSAETNLYNFDMAAAYTAFVASIDDAQHHACEFFNRTYCEGHGGYGVGGLNGSIPDVVPFYGHGRQQGDPAWGAAYTLLPDWVDSWYRDDSVFSEHYAGITAHLDQLILVAEKNNADGLLTFGLYSDWCPPAGCSGFTAGTKEEDPSGLCPPTTATNSMMVSSFYFIQQLRIVAKFAERLGHHADAARYAAVLDQLPAAFNKHYFFEGNSTHSATYTEPHRHLSPQMSISLAWQLGVIPPQHKPAVVQSLVDDVAAQGYHLNVGIIGVKFLFPTLAEAGRGDVALMVQQIKTPPSYVYMVEQGATTLWETWESTRYDPGGSPACEAGCGVPSWNHIMYGGGTSEFYFKHLAGIQQAPTSRGWERIVLKPAVWVPARNLSICANLSSAEASVVTSRGPIRAAWRCASVAAPPPPPKPAHGAYPSPAAANSLCEAGSAELGGNVIERWDAGRQHEIGSLKLKCTDGGKMARVEFASYGWPTGNCSAGFHKDSSEKKCDAKDTLARVTVECVGKSACTLTAGLQSGDTPGGGPDPCADCVKSLAVVITGCKGTSQFGAGVPPPPPPLFRYDVAVPLGATADVHLPTMGSANAQITEAGAVVWSDGKLVQGVSGVMAGEAGDASGTVIVTVGSGTYSFAVH